MNSSNRSASRSRRGGAESTLEGRDIELSVSPKDIRNAARRFGFRFEGIFYNHMVVKGRNRDTAWYSILDDEWPEIRSIIQLTPSGMRGVLNDALSIYFLDPTLAGAFVARWCAGTRSRVTWSLARASAKGGHREGEAISTATMPTRLSLCPEAATGAFSPASGRICDSTPSSGGH